MSGRCHTTWGDVSGRAGEEAGPGLDSQMWHRATNTTWLDNYHSLLRLLLLPST